MIGLSVPLSELLRVRGVLLWRPLVEVQDTEHYLFVYLSLVKVLINALKIGAEMDLTCGLFELKVVTVIRFLRVLWAACPCLVAFLLFLAAFNRCRGFNQPLAGYFGPITRSDTKLHESLLGVCRQFLVVGKPADGPPPDGLSWLLSAGEQ